MSIFVKAVPAPKPRTRETVQISLLYAGILVVFAVTQLFTFDKFAEFMLSIHLPLSDPLAYAVAPVLVAAEVFALPFLLRMTLSPAFRWLSMLCGWFVAVLWLFITIWIVTMSPSSPTVGFLGTLVDLIPGWWAVCIPFALGIMAAWSSWGLWPGRITFSRK